MDIKNILEFLSAVAANNNREWMAENRSWYEQVKADFDVLAADFINQLSLFDEEVRGLQVKDCVYRIYRDTRFSPDKTPYKLHFGVYVAANGGRRSPRGGYYLHLQPGASALAAGVWCPDALVLKALRQSIYDNVEEFEGIMHEPTFARAFGDMDAESMLKTVPRGYEKDWPQADWLKRRSFTISHPISDLEVKSDRFMPTVLELCRTAAPFNRFLNYTVDEVLGL